MTPKEARARARLGDAVYTANRRAICQRSRQKLKTQVIEAYGGCCVCCGEETREFLTIDHIHGGGARHKREVAHNLYSWLKRNNFPPGFQTLCWNCNAAKFYFGGCPHRKEVP